jgi:hypothetical protein
LLNTAVTLGVGTTDCAHYSGYDQKTKLEFGHLTSNIKHSLPILIDMVCSLAFIKPDPRFSSFIDWGQRLTLTHLAFLLGSPSDVGSASLCWSGFGSSPPLVRRRVSGARSGGW